MESACCSKSEFTNRHGISDATDSLGRLWKESFSLEVSEFIQMKVEWQRDRNRRELVSVQKSEMLMSKERRVNYERSRMGRGRQTMPIEMNES